MSTIEVTPEQTKTALERLYLALDVSKLEESRRLLAKVKDSGCGAKYGKQFFTRNSPETANMQARVAGNNISAFLDVKLMDIPNTVKEAARGLGEVGTFMFNVHASGGTEMMRAAREGADEGAENCATRRPLIIAVTILTSLKEPDLRNVGLVPAGQSLEDTVVTMAKQAQDCGLDGVVASAQEAAAIKAACGSGFMIVVPGTRSAGAAKHDQKRSTTPLEAVRNGATHLVIGREATESNDPSAALVKIARDITPALAA